MISLEIIYGSDYAQPEIIHLYDPEYGQHEVINGPDYGYLVIINGPEYG